MPRSMTNESILNTPGITIWGLTGTIVLRRLLCMVINFRLLDTHSIYHLLSPLSVRTYCTPHVLRL